MTILRFGLFQVPAADAAEGERGGGGVRQQGQGGDRQAGRTRRSDVVSRKKITLEPASKVQVLSNEN